MNRRHFLMITVAVGAGTLAGPLFQGGRLISSYRATKASWEQSVEVYLQTTLVAFAEVSSTLVQHRNLKDVRAGFQQQVDSLQQAVDLSLERYNEAYDSGLADADYTCIAELYERAAGLRLEPI